MKTICTKEIIKQAESYISANAADRLIAMESKDNIVKKLIALYKQCGYKIDGKGD